MMKKTLLVLAVLSLLWSMNTPVMAQQESGIDALLQSIDSVLRNIATLIFPPREPTVNARLVDIKMLYNTDAFLVQLRGAGNAAFAASAIGDLELGLQQRTAVWDNESLRNAYDDYAAATRLAGPLLLGTAAVLSARGTGSRDIVIGLSVAGALGMVSGEALRLWRGRESHGEQARRELLAGLEPLMAQAASLQMEFEHSGVITRPQADTIVALIDRTVELSDRYDALFGAARSAAAELRASCEVYASAYPELAPKLSPEIARIDTFRAQYDRLIDEPIISKLPLMKEKLYRWRASYAP